MAGRQVLVGTVGGKPVSEVSSVALLSAALGPNAPGRLCWKQHGLERKGTRSDGADC